MSVQANTYAMIGAILPYRNDLYDSLEPYMDSAFKGIHHHEGLCVLYDGMNGEYIAVGRVIAKSGNHEGFVAPVRFPDLEEFEAFEIESGIRALFPDEAVHVEPFVLTHYR